MRAVVDTSFWIDAWRGDLDEAEKQLVAELWRSGGSVLPQIVWLELYVGLRSPEERNYLTDLKAVSQWEPLSEDDGMAAEKLADLLRKQGVVLAASDLLVLTAAHRLRLPLVHHDEDFVRVLKLPEFAFLRAR
ncbi:MAG TPA: PIN domain-containing protein [Opitutus sp.]|nr:PIN domain-containing protein [Opitutus sp.]